MDFNGNSEGDISGFDMPVDGGSSGGGTTTSTPSLDGGDASTATDIQNRMKQFGLLGLYGDNGNAMNQFGSIQGGTNIDDGSSGLGWQTDNQAWGPGRDAYGNNSQVGGAGQDYTGVQNGSTSDFGWSPGQLASLGFKGGDLNVGAPTPDGQLAGSNVADYNAWLASQGYTNKTLYSDGGANTSALFDKNGAPVTGSNRNWQSDPDTAFQLALAAASSFAGGAAAAGAASSSGVGASAATNSVLADSAAGTAGYGASSASVPGWFVNGAAGAGAGLGGSLATNGPTGQALRNAGVGALTGGFSGGVNLASDVGITDPNYMGRFNNAVMAGGRAALTGGNVGQAVLGSGVNSALGGALQLGSGALSKMGDNTGTNDDAWDFGASPANSQANFSTGPSQTLGQSIYGGGQQGGMSMPNADSPMGQYTSPSISNGGYGMATPYTGDTGQGLNITTPNTSSQASTNPFLKMFAPQSASTPNGNKPGQFDSMAGNLLQLYQAHKNASQYGALANNLNSLYSPNSPYAQQLNQALMRSDAAAGRRSQVGPRNVELQARLASLNSQNAPELAKLYASGQNNQGQELMSLMRMFQGGGSSMLGQGYNSVQNWLNPPNQSGNGYGGSGSDQYGEGYGPQ